MTMYLLIFILFTLIAIFWMKVFLNFKPEDSIGVLWLGSTTVLYVFYCADFLKMGAYILIAVNFGLFIISALYVLKKRNLSNLLKTVIADKASIIYVTYLLLLFTVVHNKVPFWGDELRYWASLPKVLYQYTVYIDNNSETHFNPIKDSIAIYKLIFASFLKYVVASLSSFLIDYGLFIVILGALSKSSDEKRILIATIVARIVSSLYNFVINRNAVFRSKNNINISMAKYYVLCICQMMCSAYMVLIGVKFCGGHESVIKLIIDSGLFIISYQIQRKWIFR